ncbi:MAG: hypothetical protein K2G36_11265, partial [Ruminococcus sp.]|nr:hypothetical protein [Ruminococcus sp.]
MNKVQDEIKKQNNPKPIKKLRPLKPVSSTAKPSDSTAKPVNKTVKPLKSTAKPVVNYDIEKIPEEKPVKKEETKKPEKIKPEKSKPEKKGFFESVKDMMYASADDDNEEEKESEEKEFKVETIEEIKPAPENISKEIPEDKPAEPVKEKSDTKKPENEKSDTKKSPEQVSEPEKKSNNNGY